MKIAWSPAADRDADEIWHFIAFDNVDAADRLVAKFHSALIMLSEQPKLGRIGRLGKSREFIVAGTPYLLIYEVTPDTIEVRRVMHGARNWPPRRKRP